MIRIFIIAIGCLALMACQSNLSQGPRPAEDLAFVLQLLGPNDSLAAANSTINTTFGLVSKGNYLGALKDLVAGQDKLLSNYPPSMYYQSLATSLSKVGEYQTVFEAWNIDREEDESVSLDSATSTIQSLQLVEARQEILQASKEQQIIMINEAHHVSLHRFFTRSLLQGLYQNGYRYLAAETLSYNDIEQLNRDKVPSFKSGIYISEPQYANLLREALELGFELVAYEERGDLSGSQRDSVQARNLANVLVQDPAAKMLVHAGFAHIYEKTNTNWIKMGQYFKEFSGTDPLTINQVELTEKGNPTFESPYYKAILSDKRLESASVLKSDGAYWMTPHLVGLVDMQVIHPRTSLHHERANWLQAESYQSLKIPKAKLENALLIQIFKASEAEQMDLNQLIPLDQVLVKNRDSDKYLFVPVYDAYVIRILDRENKVLHQYNAN